MLDKSQQQISLQQETRHHLLKQQLNIRIVRVNDGKANPSNIPSAHNSYLRLDISFMCFTSISPQVRVDIKQVLLRIGGCRPSADPMPTMLQSVILSAAPILTDRRTITRQSLQQDIKQRYMSQSILEWGRLWSSRWRRAFPVSAPHLVGYPEDLVMWGPRLVHSSKLGVVLFTLSSYPWCKFFNYGSTPRLHLTSSLSINPKQEAACII